MTAFTVKADGVDIEIGNFGVAQTFGRTDVQVWNLSPVIRQGQAVVVTYTDPTSGDDTAALQDVAVSRTGFGRGVPNHVRKDVRDAIFAS